MAAHHTPLFMDWELDTSTSNELKQEKQLSASERRYYSFCRRKVRQHLKLHLVVYKTKAKFEVQVFVACNLSQFFPGLEFEPSKGLIK